MVIEELKSILLNGVARVHFTKLNGESRTMICSWNETWIPDGVTDKLKESIDSPVDGERTYFAVWDLEKNGWRSFRIDSVSHFADITNEMPVF